MKKSKIKIDIILIVYSSSNHILKKRYNFLYLLQNHLFEVELLPKLHKLLISKKKIIAQPTSRPPRQTTLNP